MDNEKLAGNTGELEISIPHSNSCEISENDRQWLRSLEKYPADTGSTSGKPKMHMVPKKHRDVESNVKCYEPVVVAIGPIHHRKPDLQPMEEYKQLLASQFAEKCNSASAIEVLYTSVKNIVPSVRGCYAEDLIKCYTDGEFAKMMFLDGCFILEYINRLLFGNYKQLRMKSHDIAFIRRDIFLLENQLPFEVLQVLMSHHMYIKNDGLRMIKTFILTAHALTPRYHGFVQSIKDFFLKRYTFTKKVMNFFGKNCEGEGPSYIKKQSSKDSHPAHLLELLRTQRIDPDAFSVSGTYLRGQWWSHRSAMELKRAGINFGCGRSRCLSDIKFNSFLCSALITLPPITIGESTKSELLNLVAYEACPDTPDDLGVTSYICFMHSLIKNAEDVKELSSKGIVRNFLGSDQEVADLFKEIARDLVPHPHAFADVKNHIETYYLHNTKGKTLVAEIKSTYFTSPLTVFAFFAAIFAIFLQVAGTVLSGIQTYYAIHPKKQ